MEPSLSWGCAIAWGYLLSLGGGTALASLYHWWATRYVDKFARPFETEEEKKNAGVTGWVWASVVTGMVERLIFTAFVIVAPKDAILAMGGWLTLKMAASWQREKPAGTGQYRWISSAFVGLQTGFVSMAFAAAGGLLALYLAGEVAWPPDPFSSGE